MGLTGRFLTASVPADLLAYDLCRDNDGRNRGSSARSDVTRRRWKAGSTNLHLHEGKLNGERPVCPRFSSDLHVYGSANLVQTLLKHDLVDAFWLKIFPITLGGGKRLFADGTIPAAFKVTESTVTSKGVIIVHYERTGAVPTGSL